MRGRVVYINQMSNQNVVADLYTGLCPDVSPFPYEAVMAHPQTSDGLKDAQSPMHASVRADPEVFALPYIRYVCGGMNPDGVIERGVASPLLGIILGMHPIQMVQT